MAHLDGINFGRDQVSGWDEPQLEFTMGNWNNRDILVANSEIPKKKTLYSNEITDPQAVVDLGTETFVGPRANERNFKGSLLEGLNMEHLILILLVLVFALQIKILIRPTVMFVASPFSPLQAASAPTI